MKNLYKIIIRATVISQNFAQGQSLNYETLSSLEEPLAFEVGDVTFVTSNIRFGGLFR